jgi:hypothetical protein
MLSFLRYFSALSDFTSCRRSTLLLSQYMYLPFLPLLCSLLSRFLAPFFPLFLITFMALGTSFRLVHPLSHSFKLSPFIATSFSFVYSFKLSPFLPFVFLFFFSNSFFHIHSASSIFHSYVSLSFSVKERDHLFKTYLMTWDWVDVDCLCLDQVWDMWQFVVTGYWIFAFSKMVVKPWLAEELLKKDYAHWVS